MEDLADFATEEVEMFADDLAQSVQKRIEVTVEKGSDLGHGERLGAEPDLLKSVEKHLEDRK